jgi:iron complex transport system substrate-binding protein
MSEPGRFLGVALLLSGSLAAHAGEAPGRVMSLNFCSDQIVLRLLPPERIASVSFLAHISSDPVLSAEAAKVGINYGSAEEVFAQKPDLVISGGFSTPATRALLARAGYPHYEMPPQESFAAIRDVTRALALRLGVEDRGEALLAEMDATLAELERTRPARAVRIVAWDGSGLVPGEGTLFTEMITYAGAVNVAAEISDAYFVQFDIEQLLEAQPDLIAYGASDLDTPSLRHQPLTHPVVQRIYAGRQIAYPEHFYSCGGPQSADAARDLADAMRRALGEGS